MLTFACATLLAPGLASAVPLPLPVAAPQAATPADAHGDAAPGDHHGGQHHGIRHHGDHHEGDKPCGDCEHHDGGDCADHAGTSPCNDDADDLDGVAADCPMAGGPHHGEQDGEDGGDHPGMGHDRPMGMMGMPHGMPPMFQHMMANREFHPEALLQLQPALWTGKDNQLARGDRAERGGFAMRTARFGFAGELGPRIRYVLDTDLVTIQTLPVTQAFVGVRAWRGAELLAGAQKMPFSRFAMLGSGEQALIERPMSVQAMAPFYQLGTSMTGHYPKIAGLRWFLGAFNSFERNTNFYAGIRENAGLTGNRFGGLSYVARVQVEPLGNLGRPVADLDRRDFRFEIGAGALHNDGGTTTVNAVTADVQVKWHGAHAIAEVLADTAEPKDNPQTPQTIPEKLTRRAIIGEVGYALYHWNIAARIERVDPNTTVKDGRDETILSAATGWQMMRNRLRLQLQYDHRAEALSPVMNDTLFGQVQLRL